MSVVRRMARRVLSVVDRLYGRWHRLAPVGPVLFVGQVRYDGPSRRFADGTQLMTGDTMGTLHVNNARIAALDGSRPGAMGLRFRRLLFTSLPALAELSQRDQTFSDVAVYRGIGWLRHGEKIGFIHERPAGGWRNRCVALHIRLLVWAFAPPGGTAAEARPELTVTWLTRRALLERFGGEAPHG